MTCDITILDQLSWCIRIVLETLDQLRATVLKRRYAIFFSYRAFVLWIFLFIHFSCTYYQLYVCDKAQSRAAEDLTASSFSSLIDPDKVSCLGTNQRGGPGMIVSTPVIHRACTLPCSSSYPTCRRQIIGQTNECHSKWMTEAANCNAATTAGPSSFPND